MFVVLVSPSARTETKTTKKIPCQNSSGRGQFYSDFCGSLFCDEKGQQTTAVEGLARAIFPVNGFKKNHYLCGRFRNSKNEMQQNRMNITATNICRGSKGFEGMLYAPMSSILTFDNIGNTIPLKYTRTRIL